MTTTVVGLDELHPFLSEGWSSNKFHFEFFDCCADWHWARKRLPARAWPRGRPSERPQPTDGPWIIYEDGSTFPASEYSYIADVMSSRYGRHGDRLDTSMGRRKHGRFTKHPGGVPDSQVRTYSSGNPTGRPRARRKGATGVELIRARLEGRLNCTLEAATATLHRGAKTKDEQPLYDDLARIVAELVGARTRPVNRLALAEVLRCSRWTVDRLVAHSWANCTVKVTTSEEYFSA